MTGICLSLVLFLTTLGTMQCKTSFPAWCLNQILLVKRWFVSRDKKNTRYRCCNGLYSWERSKFCFDKQLDAWLVTELLIDLWQARWFTRFTDMCSCILPPAQCWLHTAYCTQPRAFYLLYPAPCPLHSAPWTWHAVPSILHTTYCMLHSAYCVLLGSAVERVLCGDLEFWPCRSPWPPFTPSPPLLHLPPCAHSPPFQPAKLWVPTGQVPDLPAQ